MVLLHLKRAMEIHMEPVDRMGPEAVFMEALEDLTLVRAAMVIMSIILKIVIWVIWEIFSEISLEICSMVRKNSGYSRQSSGFGGQGFHSGFGGSGFGGHSQEKGSDLRSEVSISFEDAAFGCDKMIRLSNPSGSGSQTLQVHVPAGIENGKSIRLKGKGNPGFNGGEAGDLLLKVNIQPKPGYERNGMDVYTTTEIPFTTAVFGGEAKVSTLYGDVICRIPEGAQTGRKIRLKGKGIVSMKNPSVHGDQYVTIRIQVPQNLSPEAKEKLREFQQVCRNDERKRRGSVA